PDAWLYFQTTHDAYQASTEAEREFRGFGPMLSLDGEIPVLGNEQLGRVKLAWAVGGGALFGKQETEIEGSERHAAYSGKYLNFPGALVEPATITPVLMKRNTSVTVPVVDLSAGLSYEIERIKLSAGYRWERYFDVVDAGYAEHKDYDRTMEGPY